MKHSRKNPRLTNFDYTSPGYYFVTICTKHRAEVLGHVVSGGGGTPPLQDFDDTLCRCELSLIGKRTEETIQYINRHYAGVEIEHFAIMPNHIHLLIRLHPTVGGGFHAAPQRDRTMGGGGTPPLHRVVGQLKSYTQRNYEEQLWQRGFHDHIIRNEIDYTNIVEYIQQNPTRWAEDCHNPKSDNFKEMRE